MTRYHRGRAEVTGFAVADRAVVGDVPGALEALRWALAVGVAHVLVADALADGVRSIARVSSRRARQPVRAGELARDAALEGEAGAVAGPGLERRPGSAGPCGPSPTLNADVKGVAADPSYALEAAIRDLAAARAAAD